MEENRMYWVPSEESDYATTVRLSPYPAGSFLDMP